MKKISIASAIASIVFGPTLFAYLMLAVRYRFTGISVYLIAIFIAYNVGVFENLQSWPKVSRFALYTGPVLIIAGLYFSTQVASYSMMIPTVVYGAFCIVAGIALVGKF